MYLDRKCVTWNVWLSRMKRMERLRQKVRDAEIRLANMRQIVGTSLAIMAILVSLPTLSFAAETEDAVDTVDIVDGMDIVDVIAKDVVTDSEDTPDSEKTTKVDESKPTKVNPASDFEYTTSEGAVTITRLKNKWATTVCVP